MVCPFPALKKKIAGRYSSLECLDERLFGYLLPYEFDVIIYTCLYNNNKESGCIFYIQPLRFVGVPGFEPGKTGPESVVLPLHHTPIWESDAKLKSIFELAKLSELFYMRNH